jgi:hypothetical protein
LIMSNISHQWSSGSFEWEERIEKKSRASVTGEDCANCILAVSNVDLNSYISIVSLRSKNIAIYCNLDMSR